MDKLSQYLCSTNRLAPLIRNMIWNQTYDQVMNKIGIKDFYQIKVKMDTQSFDLVWNEIRNQILEEIWTF